MMGLRKLDYAVYWVFDGEWDCPRVLNVQALSVSSAKSQAVSWLTNTLDVAPDLPSRIPVGKISIVGVAQRTQIRQGRGVR